MNKVSDASLSCSVADCDRRIAARGFCMSHWRFNHLYGSPTIRIRRVPGSGAIKDGYIILGANKRLKRQHVARAEEALGRSLPDGAVVHHVDGNRTNNENSNLIVCPDHDYHMLIHVRTRAINACGNADWRLCCICRNYDSIDRMVRHNPSGFYHRRCHADYERKRRTLKKGNPQ